MLGNPGTYANKKRKKPVLKQKKALGVKDAAKSNPSKRHRDRLNAELDWLLDLLPFSQEVRSGLDKLSVLRLSVGYLKAKSHFTASISSALPVTNGNSLSSAEISEGDLLLQALNGFVMVVSTDGLVFYVSPTIKDYLGFSQSDILHQSVYELIHTDDRLAFREQLSAQETQNCASCGSVTFDPDEMTSESCSLQMRSFVCRFRCLLDNSSGFLALKASGRLRFLHGLNGGGKRPPQMALFMVASPVQPPSIVEIRAKLLLYQTKHQLDFTPVGIDSRGSSILGYSETELVSKGSGYQFIHAADMMYCADIHIRMMKTGETGLTVFRLLSKSQTWIWVKSNAKLIFKGGQPQFIIAYQKALTNAEGEAYLCQRRLELPFNSATGEGILYNTGATMDILQHQFNKRFGNNNMRNDVMTNSLLDCFLNQDENNLYSQTVETHLPLDQIFMDSHALVSVQSNSWQESTAAQEEQVKEEPQEAMDCLDELEELENALRRLGQESNFIDTILFRHCREFGASALPSCLARNQDSLEVLPPSGLQLDDIFSPSIELPELLPEDQHLPQNHFQSSPLNRLQAAPLNHLQAPPLNRLQAAPLNHLQSSPLSHLQAPPLNHLQAPPLNNLQFPPLNNLGAPPLNHLQAPPLNHLQASPQNPIQAPPPNQIKAPLPNLLQAPPINHLQAPHQNPIQAPPPNQIQAPPHNLLQTLPPSHMQNPLQAPPQNHIQTPPINHFQTPPPKLLQAPPLNHVQALPPNPFHAPGGVGLLCCPPGSVPHLLPSSSNSPLPVAVADPSHWLMNRHEATPTHQQQLGEPFTFSPAGGHPLQDSAYFQWK